jgi:hypothetical protein
MRNNLSKVFALISAALLVLALGVGTDTLAQKGGKGGGQGNGNGHGKGNGGGNGNGNGLGRGQGSPNAGQPGGWQQVQRQAPPRVVQPQVYRPQKQVYQPQYNVRQEKHAWKQERKVQKFEQRVWRQPQVAAQQHQGPPAWSRVWTAPGQARKAEKQFAKQQRKEEKAWVKYVKHERKAQARPNQPEIWRSVSSSVQYPNRYYQRRSYAQEYYAPPQAEYYAQPNYQYSYPAPQVQYVPREYYSQYPAYDYSDAYYQTSDLGSVGDLFGGGSNWTELLLGTVLNAFLGGELGGREFYAQPSYDNYYGSSAPYNRYNGYQQYGSYYDRSFGSYDGSISNYSPYYGGHVLFDYEQGPYSGDYTDELVRRAYNSGYEQGYMAGQAARYNGYSGSAYEDPYFFENDGYGYGAYSISMNRQRRCLSEGYERGYLDALDRNDEYDSQFGGDVDLVSLMLSSVLGMFNV